MNESPEKLPSGDSLDVSELQKKVNKVKSPESHAEIDDETTRGLLQAIDILNILEKDLSRGSTEAPYLMVHHAREQLDKALQKHMSEQE